MNIWTLSVVFIWTKSLHITVR